jgi:shikimate dehydrogenase
VKVIPSQLVLLGHPVAHSLSPAFHNAALRSAGLPLEYRALDVAPAELADVLRALVARGAAGNVTAPHKRAVFALCDERTEVAERASAVNTWWTRDGALVGDNTDVGGFEAAVAGLLGRRPANQRVALLGAGGAAAAVLVAAERWPNSYVRVHARTAGRAIALCEPFADHAHAARTLDEALDGATLVVNATPVGMSDDLMPLAPERIPRKSAAVDLVYRRGETAWVRALRARRRLAVDGLPMLIEQGALAFERWFGEAANREAMWNAVR